MQGSEGKLQFVWQITDLLRRQVITRETYRAARRKHTEKAA